jgi:hypothetical protein
MDAEKVAAHVTATIEKIAYPERFQE